jgi:uncharacterized membrane protein HdeD (DUF308 family)
MTMTGMATSDATSRHASTADELAPPPAVPGADRLANHWGLVLGYGLVSVGLGLVLAFWPEETLVVCAVLVAIQLLISGVYRIVMSIGARGLDGGMRALMALTGGLALIVGLLCLRDPVQTLLFVGILIGMWWVVSGVVDVVGALVAPVHGHRAWDLVTGLISILAGGFLLVNPSLSLGVLVVVICAWMFLIGALALVAAFRMRAELHHRAPAAGPSAAPAV